MKISASTLEMEQSNDQTPALHASDFVREV